MDTLTQKAEAYCKANPQNSWDAKKLAYTAGFQEAMKEQRWIPVSESLPQEDEWVLVYTNIDEVKIGRYICRNQKWTVGDYEYHKGSNVAAYWLPIPPPQEQK